jgi:hypothetical protein
LAERAPAPGGKRRRVYFAATLILAHDIVRGEMRGKGAHAIEMREK